MPGSMAVVFKPNCASRPLVFRMTQTIDSGCLCQAGASSGSSLSVPVSCVMRSLGSYSGASAWS